MHGQNHIKWYNLLCTFIHEKLNFPCNQENLLLGTQILISVLTESCHLILFWDSRVKATFTPCLPTFEYYLISSPRVSLTFKAQNCICSPVRAKCLLLLSSRRTFYCVHIFKTPLCVLWRTRRAESFGRRAVECLFVWLVGCSVCTVQTSRMRVVQTAWKKITKILFLTQVRSEHIASLESVKQEKWVLNKHFAGIQGLLYENVNWNPSRNHVCVFLCVFVCVCVLSVNISSHSSVHVCMYVCMYVCMHVCMHVCMYACMYASMYVCMFVCLHVCIQVCMYACLYVCMYVCTFVCMHVCIQVCMYACLYVCMYVYMYACMYTCMHVCMYAWI